MNLLSLEQPYDKEDLEWVLSVSYLTITLTISSWWIRYQSPLMPFSQSSFSETIKHLSRLKILHPFVFSLWKLQKSKGCLIYDCGNPLRNFREVKRKGHYFNVWGCKQTIYALPTAPLIYIKSWNINVWCFDTYHNSLMISYEKRSFSSLQQFTVIRNDYSLFVTFLPLLDLQQQALYLEIKNSLKPNKFSLIVDESYLQKHINLRTSFESPLSLFLLLKSVTKTL